MKQIQYDRYGPPEVLHVTEVEKPRIKPGHILIKTAYTAVNASDSRIRGARFPEGYTLISKLVFGVTKPRNKVLGGSFSGVVEEVASDVTDYKVGDRVCGMTGISQGCNSEYILKKTSYCTAKIPDDINMETACAVLFGGTAAQYFVRDVAKIQSGEKILINGASGSVGSAMVPIAKHMGAEVTGVCSSKNCNLVSSLGADHAIDYGSTPVQEITNKYNVIIDTVGNLTFDAVKNLLTENGRVVLVSGSIGQALSCIVNKKLLSGVAPEKKEDVESLFTMIQNEELKPVISYVYDYKDIQQAHAEVDSGRKVGNTIIEW